MYENSGVISDFDGYGLLPQKGEAGLKMDNALYRVCLTLMEQF